MLHDDHSSFFSLFFRASTFILLPPLHQSLIVYFKGLSSFFLFTPTLNCVFSKDFHRSSSFIPIFICVFQSITFIFASNQGYQTMIRLSSERMTLSSKISQKVDYHLFFSVEPSIILSEKQYKTYQFLEVPKFTLQ